jgi:arylsulfatase A-like enzyme
VRSRNEQDFGKPGLSRRTLLRNSSIAALAAIGSDILWGGPTKAGRPNVVFIVCDDLNDSVEGMGGHPQARTPNIHRLMEKGFLFTNAHSNAPICAPARACMFSGIYPHHSGLIEFKPFSSSELLKNSVTLFEHFKNNGYDIYGTGKLFHYQQEFAHIWQDPDGTSHYGADTEYGPFPFDGKKANMEVIHPSLKFIEDLIKDHNSKLWNARGEHSFAPLSDVPSEPKYPGWKGWRYYNRPFRYVNDSDRDLMPDELSANFASQVLSRRHDKPFLLGVGMMKPHTPLYAPKKYFDMFPIEEIQLPPYKEDDLDDCQDFVKLVFQYGFERHDLYTKTNLWKRFIQAYLACTAFVDEQVGVVLDAIEKSPYRDNTLVVLTGDNGFHMGQKHYNFKLTNWEEATRIPMVIAAPGANKRGQACDHPVSHVDLYPTLVDYCGLPKDPNIGRSGHPLCGHSMRTLIENPANGKWDGPDVALIAVYGENGPDGKPCHNFSVRSRRWRYTLYQNGAEELYDHEKDPHEWFNLAKDSAHSSTKAELRKKLLAMLGPAEL